MPPLANRRNRTEFTLPDRLGDLIEVEQQLLAEFRKIEAQYKQLRIALPAGANPMKSPLFFELLVVHRKWLFAHEKRQQMSSSKV